MEEDDGSEDDPLFFWSPLRVVLDAGAGEGLLTGVRAGARVRGLAVEVRVARVGRELPDGRARPDPRLPPLRELPGGVILRGLEEWGVETRGEEPR